MTPATGGIPAVGWVASEHAIRQYQERFEPLLSLPEIAELLTRRGKGATITGVRPDRKVLYGHPDNPLVGYVVSRDRVGGLPTLVTVVDVRPARSVELEPVPLVSPKPRTASDIAAAREGVKARELARVVADVRRTALRGVEQDVNAWLAEGAAECARLRREMREQRQTIDSLKRELEHSESGRLWAERKLEQSK